MYDTFHAHIEHNQKINRNQLLNSLNNHGEHRNEYGYSIGGNLKNLRIYCNDEKLFIKGSLAKFHYGENQSSLDIKTTKTVLENISDIISIDLNSAIIDRLDIGCNIIVKHPPKCYFDLLGEARYYNRLTQPNNGLLYHTTKRRMAFYDKIEELKKSKTPVIADFEFVNVLRYELRLFTNKKISNSLQTPTTSIYHLYQEDFYKKAVSCWKEEFYKILKYTDNQIFNDDVYISSKKFIDQIILQGINSLGGVGAMVSTIKHARNKGVFERQDQYARLMRTLKRYNTLSEQTSKDNLIAELENKIDQIYSDNTIIAL